jgi:hypothetical protein
MSSVKPSADAVSRSDRSGSWNRGTAGNSPTAYPATVGRSDASSLGSVSSGSGVSATALAVDSGSSAGTAEDVTGAASVSVADPHATSDTARSPAPKKARPARVEMFMI